MMISMEQLVAEAIELPSISEVSLSAWSEKCTAMTAFVNESMSARSDIQFLIGNNPLRMMFDNHENHVAFMRTVFGFGNYEMLAKTLPWVYRSYSAHHFSHDYFLVVLGVWLESLSEFMESDLSVEIRKIYEWIISRHADIVQMSKIGKAESSSGSFKIDNPRLETKNLFLSALLEGEHKKCLKIANELVSEGIEIEDFYMNIVQPSMYEIGNLWEKGRVSVAQEYLASAIVGRVLVSISMIVSQTREKAGKIVVASAPNEYHEIGGWMISDIMEHSGWTVRYLGANMPCRDLLDLLRTFQPEILALSVTMAFNVLELKSIIASVRSDNSLSGIKIMVGGQPFNQFEGLWRETGADGFASDPTEARELARRWIQK
ncbi:MAG: hypothetical protein CVV64_10355 [Candidatus Wallbacteria bacterium HGW-Wallbacteria-1]|jgi:methanogenic corrinoid protein MtbC1|uniref:B12-binding domain-containing protein n=1 Tax=Candidatus Wallbacteria bacterium HGW-Wallbacteria-1 TaxID=2013854 RepID=A0A2N1PPT8_9BACT|nr:MAG: hypothetical protein CVV64_10355 [Candidatus Wallbacteria bacterium HGW-Wallbacteria-1]